MDTVTPASGPKAPEAAAVLDPAAWQQELEGLVAAVQATLTEWGARADSREAKFVSAMLGTTRWLGRLSLETHANAARIAGDSRAAAQTELALAREITAATKVALLQARDAQIQLVVEKETLVARMIKDTLPLFAERLQGALHLREQRWSDDVQRRRFAVVGLVTIALLAGGYGLRAWEDQERTSALRDCVAHPVQIDGHAYCDVTGFQPWRR